jgi:gas vesicle protein
MSTTYIDELRQKRDGLVDEFDEKARRIKALPDDATEEERDLLKAQFDRLQGSVERLTEDIENAEKVAEARAKLAPQDDDEIEGAGKEQRKRLSINEPLVYERTAGHSYFKDVYLASSKEQADRRRRSA